MMAAVVIWWWSFATSALYQGYLAAWQLTYTNARCPLGLIGAFKGSISTVHILSQWRHISPAE